MKRRRSIPVYLCLCAFVGIAATAAFALTPADENHGEPLVPIPLYPLPAEELAYLELNYPEFYYTFACSLYWDPTDQLYSEGPASWPWPFYDPDPFEDNGTMEEFVNVVMPPALPEDDMYDESAMRRTFYYFGHDWGHDNDDEPWEPYYPTYVHWIVGDQWDYITQFILEVRPPGQSHIGGNRLQLGLADSPITTPAMAFDTFAHEWKHMIQGTIGWLYGYHLGSDQTSNEFFAQCAEYLSGWHWIDPTIGIGTSELPFTRGLFTGDYYQACEVDPEDPTLPGHPQVLKHMTYSMFAPYLMDHYSLGDGYANKAMFRWIHSKLDPEQAGELPSRGDLKALSLLLVSEDEYSNFFSSETGDARVRELFQEFALSLWVNDPGLMGEASVWANGDSPSETHGYMVDFDGYCYNDVHTLPLYNIVASTPKSQTDWITSLDLYPDSPACAGSPPYPRRAIQVSTYGYNVLPFIADPSIQDEALAYDLRVDVSVDSTYWCDLADDDVDVELTGNEVLHFYVLGYPEATSDLHEAGAEAELINTYEYSDFDIQATPTFSFSVGRFGVRYKSVVLIMTATEKELEDGFRTATVIPFDYSYWAEGHTTPITADTFWPPATLVHDGIVSLNGEVTVEAGAKLTIMPGTQIFCADQAAVVGEVVGFDVEGVLQIGAPSGATVHVDPAQGTWTGISVANYAALNVFSSDIKGFSEISAGSNAIVDLSESSFELAEAGAGYSLAGAGSAEVAGCQFAGSGVFTLGGSAQVGPHALTSSQFASEAGCPALFFAGDAIVDDVTVLAAGPIVFGSGDITVTGLHASVAGVEGHEWGLLVGVGARLTLNDSELIGLTELSAGTGATVAISGTSFELDSDGVGYALAAADTIIIQDCQFTGAGILSLGNTTGAHSLSASTFSPLAGGARCTELVVENSASIAGVLLSGGGIRCTGGALELDSVGLNAPNLAIPLKLTGLLLSGDAVVQADECTIAGFDHAISIDDTAMLTLRSSYLDGMDVGVILNTTQVVDLGHDGSIPDSPNWGNSCFEMASGATCRISAIRKNASCLAERNYWGAETPLEGFFCGVSVDYEPFLSECPLEPPGGGQFNIGIVLPEETSGTALKLTVYPNPGNPSFAIGTVLPVSWEVYSLAIYDVTGRLVRWLAMGTADGHEHQVTWDGNDQYGNPSGSGVYFVRVKVGASTTATQKLVLVR